MNIEEFVKVAGPGAPGARYRKRGNLDRPLMLFRGRVDESAILVQDAELLTDYLAQRVRDFGMAGDRSTAAVLRVGVEIVALAVSLEKTTGVPQLAEECPASHTANASAFRRTPRRRMGCWSFRTRR